MKKTTQPLKKSPLLKRYQNPFYESLSKRLWNFFLYGLGFYKKKQLYSKPPKKFEYPQKKQTFKKDQPFIQWINHSTFLVKVGSTTFLTDPIFSKRCSFVSFMGPKRKHPPGLKIEELPEIDIVLISHDHYDHLDKKSVLALNKRFPEILWCVPKKVKKWFLKLNINHVIEFDWSEHHFLKDRNIKITAVPAQHFSGRSPFKMNHSLWLGYVVECLDQKKTFYFAGDTGYNPVHFKEIGEHYQGFDLSIIPIGAYLPKCFMRAVHVCPIEAVQIHLDVSSKLSVASHFKTFDLAFEELHQPPYDLYCALEEAELDHNTFCVLQPGQTLNW